MFKNRKFKPNNFQIILAIAFLPVTIIILLIYLLVKLAYFLKNKTTKKQEEKKQNYNFYNFNNKDYRKKWSKDYQCADGHYVRSLSEQSIDNWLYNNGYQHSYEKAVFMKTKPDAVVLSDFYLPKENIYIEFWGIENDEQ